MDLHISYLQTTFHILCIRAETYVHSVGILFTLSLLVGEDIAVRYLPLYNNLHNNLLYTSINQFFIFYIYTTFIIICHRGSIADAHHKKIQSYYI